MRSVILAWQYFIQRKQENGLSFTFPTLLINPIDIWYVGFQLPLCTLVDCQEACSVLFTACDIVYHHMTEFRSARKFIRIFCLSKFSLTLVKYDCFLLYGFACHRHRCDRWRAGEEPRLCGLDRYPYDRHPVCVQQVTTSQAIRTCRTQCF